MCYGLLVIHFESTLALPTFSVNRALRRNRGGYSRRGHKPGGQPGAAATLATTSRLAARSISVVAAVSVNAALVLLNGDGGGSDAAPAGRPAPGGRSSRAPGQIPYTELAAFSNTHARSSGLKPAAIRL